MVSTVLQNFHQESEKALCKQINLELHASYVYRLLAYQFERGDIALNGFAKFFRENSLEESGHADKLLKYLNDRGGNLQADPIQVPSRFDFTTGLEAMQAALQLERDVNDNLLKLHAVADKHEDPHLTDFISEFLDEQVKSIKLINNHIANLRRVGSGLGEFQFDKIVLGG